MRQYLGLISAVVAYYIFHEGAHLVYALAAGVFRQINFMGLGMQIDVYAENMTDTQLGVFCLVGSLATLAAAYILVLLADKIGRLRSKVMKACFYYITIAMLLLDPAYLCIIFKLFGGGDMNGIALLVPQTAAQIAYGVLLALNILVFWKVVLPKYKRAFAADGNE